MEGEEKADYTLGEGKKCTINTCNLLDLNQLGISER